MGAEWRLHSDSGADPGPIFDIDSFADTENWWAYAPVDALHLFPRQAQENDAAVEIDVVMEPQSTTPAGTDVPHADDMEDLRADTPAPDDLFASEDASTSSKRTFDDGGDAQERIRKRGR